MNSAKKGNEAYKEILDYFPLEENELRATITKILAIVQKLNVYSHGFIRFNFKPYKGSQEGKAKNAIIIAKRNKKKQEEWLKQWSEHWDNIRLKSTKEYKEKTPEYIDELDKMDFGTPSPEDLDLDDFLKM